MILRKKWHLVAAILFRGGAVGRVTSLPAAWRCDRQAGKKKDVLGGWSWANGQSAGAGRFSMITIQPTKRD